MRKQKNVQGYNTSVVIWIILSSAALMFVIIMVATSPRGFLH